jgi:tRNA G37 N-methylase TrmD
MKFELSKVELWNWRNFQQEMEEKYVEEEKYCGAAGGFYKITFIPTGLGVIVEASTIKGDVRDITDWDLF